MSLSLRFQLNTLIALVFVILVMGFAWQQVRSTRASVSQEIALADAVAAAALTRAQSVYDQAGLAAVHGFLLGEKQVPGNDVTLYDEQGRVLASLPSGRVAPEPARRAPDWFVQMVSPIEIGTTLELGQARLAARPVATQAAVAGWRGLRLQTGMLVAGYLLLTLLASALVGSAVRPLRRLGQAMRAVGRGDLRTRPPRAGSLEMAALRQSFDGMVEALRASFEAREEAARHDGAEARTRELSGQWLRRIEHEHAGWARQLHDDLAQHTAAIRAMGQSLTARAGAGVPGDDELAGELLESADALEAGLHEMLSQLRPVALDAAGLADALGDLVGYWRRKQPLVRVTLRIGPGLDSLTPAVATVAYRIAQEGLTNAIRHGGVQQIEVSLRALDEALILQIQDDGNGSSGKGLSPGFGLTGMLERAEAVGGQVGFGRSRLGGVQVRATLPLHQGGDVLLARTSASAG